jgi:hypothetical protein
MNQNNYLLNQNIKAPTNNNSRLNIGNSDSKQAFKNNK